MMRRARSTYLNLNQSLDMPSSTLGKGGGRQRAAGQMTLVVKKLSLLIATTIALVFLHELGHCVIYLLLFPEMSMPAIGYVTGFMYVQVIIPGGLLRSLVLLGGALFVFPVLIAGRTREHVEYWSPACGYLVYSLLEVMFV